VTWDLQEPSHVYEAICPAPPTDRTCVSAMVCAPPLATGVQAYPAVTVEDCSTCEPHLMRAAGVAADRLLASHGRLLLGFIDAGFGSFGPFVSTCEDASNSLLRPSYDIVLGGTPNLARPLPAPQSQLGRTIHVLFGRVRCAGHGTYTISCRRLPAGTRTRAESRVGGAGARSHRHVLGNA